jgi:hypothetical protein
MAEPVARGDEPVIPAALVASAARGSRRDDGRRRQIELTGQPPEHLALVRGLMVDGEIE